MLGAPALTSARLCTDIGRPPVELDSRVHTGSHVRGCAPNVAGNGALRLTDGDPRLFNIHDGGTRGVDRAEITAAQGIGRQQPYSPDRGRCSEMRASAVVPVRRAKP